MSYSSAATLAVISAVAFCWQLLLRKRSKDWLIDFASMGVMTGFLGVGLLELIVTWNLNAAVPLVWYYAPHAYNLIIWPALAIMVLRPRFGGVKFLLAFVFVYALDEVFWNLIAYFRFDGGPQVTNYMLTPYWLTFFTIIVSSLAASYYLLRPKVIPNWTWGCFVAYVFLYAVVAGLPTYVNAGSGPDWYIWTWELLWQAAFWLFVYGTFRQKFSTDSAPLSYVQSSGERMVARESVDFRSQK